MRLQLVVMSCCVAAAVCVATDVFLCSGALDGLSVVMCSCALALLTVRPSFVVCPSVRNTHFLPH